MGKAVKLGDREFPIEKPSAAQILGLAQFFSRTMLRARLSLSEEFDIVQPADIEFVLGFLNVLTPDELIDLAAMLLQTEDKGYVEANFDLGAAFQAFRVWGEAANLGEILKNLATGIPTFMGVPGEPEKPKKRLRKEKEQ